jgi:hypothetical protein
MRKHHDSLPVNVIATAMPGAVGAQARAGSPIQSLESIRIPVRSAITTSLKAGPVILKKPDN